MRQLPLEDPGTADHRSPGRFLWWMARQQWRTLVVGMCFGIVWMSAQAVMPAIIGRAIDHGVAARDGSALLEYAALLLGVGLVQATAGIIRHRYAVTNWLTAAYTVLQLTSRQAVRLGASLPRQISTGEVSAIGTSDMSHIGQVMDVSARFSGAVVSFVLVAVILLQTSVTLGVMVLVGTPLLMLLIAPILPPLQRRQAHQRELMGRLANTAADIVGGLRVLRGIGGEQVFLARYRRQSQEARRAGVRVAGVQSVLDATEVFLPGVFVVAVVWLGAHYAVEGRISPGDLVAFYGYSAFLMIPLRTATEYANKVIRGRVSARRVAGFLALEPDHADVPPLVPDVSVDDTPAGTTETSGTSGLHDRRSGLVVRPGTLTAIVSEQPDESAALADRLGRIAPVEDDEVTLDGVPITALPVREVRRRVVVSDTAAQLFSGRLGDRLDVRGAGAAVVERALAAASAEDVLAPLDDGLDSVVAERGRSFSGGQRQRLILARALALDPEVLILVEPTSAVDAHTEARIAAALGPHRAGRTTVVTTTSPLVLDAVDEVAFLEEGRVVASGRHRDLLDSCPAYRRVVIRSVDETEEASA